MVEKIIDTQGILDLLGDFAGWTLAYLRTLTNPMAKKYGGNGGYNVKSHITGQTMEVELGINPANIRKISLYSVRIGYDYKTSQKNAYDKANMNVPPASRKPWFHHWTTPSGLVSKTIGEHNTRPELYVMCQINDQASGLGLLPANAQKKPTRIRSMLVDITTGKKIDKSLLEPWKAPGSYGVIPFQTLKLTSVKRLSFQKVVYNLA